jgi:hypothetical protein
MEIPTEAHQNEAATRVFNFEQTTRVLTCYLLQYEGMVWTITYFSLRTILLLPR